MPLKKSAFEYANAVPAAVAPASKSSTQAACLLRQAALHDAPWSPRTKKYPRVASVHAGNGTTVHTGTQIVFTALTAFEPGVEVFLGRGANRKQASSWRRY